MSVIILGIDPSLTATGAVVVEHFGNRIVLAEAMCVKPKASEGDFRLSRFRLMAAGLIDRWGRDLHSVAVEMNVKSHKQSVSTCLAQREVVAVCIEPFANARIPVQRIVPSEAKAALAAHGAAKKGSMVKWAAMICPGIFKDFPFQYQQEAVADALGIALAGMSKVTNARRER